MRDTLSQRFCYCQGWRQYRPEGFNIAVRHTIIHNYSRLVACVVEEVQFVVALGHMVNVLAMQRVLGYTSGGGSFLHTQAVLVVNKLDGFVRLLHLFELTTILPSIGPGAIVQRVANSTEKATRQCRMASGSVAGDQLSSLYATSSRQSLMSAIPPIALVQSWLIICRDWISNMNLTDAPCC